jgi:hypothetical protein
MSKIRTKLRERRNQRQFIQALDNATPTMRAELLALAARHNFVS